MIYNNNNNNSLAVAPLVAFAGGFAASVAIVWRRSNEIGMILEVWLSNLNPLLNDIRTIRCRATHWLALIDRRFLLEYTAHVPLLTVKVSLVAGMRNGRK